MPITLCLRTQDPLTATRPRSPISAESTAELQSLTAVLAELDVMPCHGNEERRRCDAHRRLRAHLRFHSSTLAPSTPAPPMRTTHAAAHSLACSSFGGQAMGIAIAKSFEVELPRDAHHLTVCRHEYQAACGQLRAQGLGVCCDGFLEGECQHGTLCECGWLRAPWPWTHYTPGGKFCDCHRDSRPQCLAFMGLTGIVMPDDDFVESSLLWPDCGPHRGSGAQKYLPAMSAYSDDIS